MSKFSDSTFYLAPSGYRESTLYPQKPLSSIGHLSVGRASSATRTNPAGQVEQVCYNLFQYSEDFTNAYWTKSLSTLTTNTTIAPDGNLTADTFTKTSGVNTVSQCGTNAPPYTNTGVHTLSVYIKPIVGNTVLLRLDNANNTANATFNFTTKTFSTSGANLISSSYQELPNGWFRLSITGNVTSTSWTAAPCLLFENPTNDSMAIWGAQLVQGNLPKDYLYTSDRLNFPRVDYSDGSASLLLEPQRTNLFSNSGWAGGTSIPTGWSSFITGTTTPLVSIKNLSVAAYRFSGTSQRAFFTQTISTTIGVTYSISVYVESVETTQNLDQVMSNYGAGVFYRNGVLISSTAPIEAGYTYTAVFTATTTSVDVRFGLGVQGPNTGNFVMSMPQFEQGAYATSFILSPTSSTATRLADTFTRNNIYTNNLISSSGGTWFVELKNNLSLTRDTFTLIPLIIGDGATSPNNGLLLRNSGGSSMRLEIRKLIAGSTTLLHTTTTDSTKLVIKWNGSTCDVFVNGIKQVSASFFATTNMDFLVGNGVDVPKYITQMALWNTPLSDSQCIELTGVAYTTPAQAYGSLNLVSESPDCLYTSVNTINRI